MNKKSLIIVGMISLFLIGIVYAWDVNDYTIKKVDGEYHIYTLTEITTIAQVENEKQILEDRKLELQNINTLENKELCLKDNLMRCKEDLNGFKEVNECVNFWDGMCEYNYIYYQDEVINLDKKIEEVDDKLKEVQKIK